MNNVYAQYNFAPRFSCLGYIKKFFSGKLVLACLILCILATVFSAIAPCFLSSVFTQGMLSSILGSDMLPPDFDYSIIDSSAYAAQSLFFISLSGIYQALFVIAPLAIIYIKSKKQDPASSPKGAFTFLYIVSIIVLVSDWLSLVGLALFLGLAFLFISLELTDVYHGNMSFTKLFNEPEEFYNDFYDLSDELIGSLALIIFLVALIVSVITIVYQTCYKNYLKSIKTSIDSPYLYNKGAKAFSVLSIITGVFSLISALISSLVLLLIIRGGNIYFIGVVLSFLGTVCTGVYQIAFGVLASRYAKFAQVSNGELQKIYESSALPIYTPQSFSQPTATYTAQSYGQNLHACNSGLSDNAQEQAETTENSSSSIPSSQANNYSNPFGDM